MIDTNPIRVLAYWPNRLIGLGETFRRSTCGSSLLVYPNAKGEIACDLGWVGSACLFDVFMSVVMLSRYWYQVNRGGAYGTKRGGPGPRHHW